MIGRGWIAAVVLAVASHAAAETARLDYRAQPIDCPSELALREAVAIRLGYDPFADGASRTVEVRIQSVDGAVIAHVAMVDASGAVTGRRDLEDTGTCAELTDVLTLAVSIAVDPARAMGIDTDVAPATPPDSVPPDEVPVARSEEPAVTVPDDRWRLGAALSLFGLVGFAPSATVGAALEGRLRRRAWSVAIAGSVELPTEAGGEDGRVSSLRATGSVVPCLHADLFAGCAIVEIGAIVGRAAGVANGGEASAPFITFGARAQFEWELAPPLAIGAFLDVRVTPTPTELQIDGQTIWGTGLVGGTLGASARLEVVP